MSQSRYNTQSCSRADPTASVEGKSPLALAMTNKDSVEFTNILKEFLVDPIIPDELKLNRMTMRIWPYSSESPSQEFKDLLASLPTDLVKLTLAKKRHHTGSFRKNGKSSCLLKSQFPQKLSFLSCFRSRISDKFISFSIQVQHDQPKVSKKVCASNVPSGLGRLLQDNH